MTSPGLAARLRGVHSGFLVFCLVLVLAGFVLPSGPEIESGPQSESGPEIELTPASPVRLSAPSIDLRASITPIEVDTSGVLDPPEDVDVVGWWKRSARPGDGTGQTVLTGHTVHSGGGVMNRVKELKKDARVRVRTPEGTMTYQVTRTAVYSQDELAKRAQSLFGQHRDDGRLVLVTCTGWENGVYTSNIIVFAEPSHAA